MNWRINYASPQGIVTHLDIEAEDRDAAIRNSKISQSSIISVSKRGGLADLFTGSPSIEVQISFLAALASSVVAGQSADNELVELAKMEPAFKSKVAAVQAKTLTSERLKVLRFSQIPVMLAEIGERSGKLGESLTTAARMMTENYRIDREMKKGILPQLILIGVMTLALCGIPYLFGPIFDELGKPGAGLVVKRTPFTEGLFLIRAMLDNFWFIILPGLVYIFSIRRTIWRKTKTWKMFSSLNELHKAQRGVSFISTFLTLDGAGVPALEILQRLRSAQDKTGQMIFGAMIDHVALGKPLSTSFNGEWWPDLMIRAVQGMEQSTPSRRGEMLKLLRENLMTKVQVLSDRTVVAFKLIGFIYLAFVLTFMVGGVYFPLMTISGV